MTENSATRNNGRWTLRYAAINALYFAGFCGIHAYASVFLLAHGFTNGQIGVLLAIANLTSVVLQPIVAAAIDKQGKVTNRNISMICTAILLAGSVVLLLYKNTFPVIFITYILIFMIQMLYQPLIIAMNFEYGQAGCRINFGLARGLGSVGFAIYSTLMGNILGKFGVDSLQVADILVLVLLLLALFTFRLPEQVPLYTNRQAETVQGKNGSFVRKYYRFMIYLVATVCFFYAHSLSNDFLIQIITPLGGNARDLGYVVSIAALLELPTMAGFMKLSEKIDCGILLLLSGIFFFLKILTLFFAANMLQVYLSYVLQIASYAMFIPASAYYVHHIMEAHDQVKGQALINCAITLGGVTSNLVCGYVLDHGGPKVMVGIGAAVCLAGVLISFGAIQKVGRRTET